MGKRKGGHQFVLSWRIRGIVRVSSPHLCKSLNIKDSNDNKRTIVRPSKTKTQTTNNKSNNKDNNKDNNDNT